MFSWLSRPKGLVGLDIGTSSVKAVQLRRLRKGYQLVALGIAPLHPDTIVDGLIMDADAVSNAVRRMFEENKIDLKDVAVSVSGHSVIVKRIAVPHMKADELRGGIAWEAEQHIPYSVEDVNLDFQILRSGDNGKGEMDVLLVAVKKDIVNQYLAVISAAGLRAAVVDVDAFAMENAFEMFEKVGRDEVVALMNIGAAVTTINVIRGGCSEFTRDSSLAGNRYTESLQKGLGLNYEQAEILKMGGAVQGHDVAEARPVFEMVNGELAGEIRRSFEFYRSSMQGGAIDRVVLSGGGSRLPDLPSHLSHALELPVEIGNPLREITADPRKFDPEYLSFIAPQMAVGVGLALREPEDGA
ncbi:MAG: type IV pilus assembly protein PilM [candidate division NC10 bacterium]|nr:type IV pilus assembly protein PilM [candidate division NC10 bacterium]